MLRSICNIYLTTTYPRGNENQWRWARGKQTNKQTIGITLWENCPRGKWLKRFLCWGGLVPSRGWNGLPLPSKMDHRNLKFQNSQFYPCLLKSPHLWGLFVPYQCLTLACKNLAFHCCCKSVILTVRQIWAWSWAMSAQMTGNFTPARRPDSLHISSQNVFILLNSSIYPSYISWEIRRSQLTPPSLPSLLLS